MWWYNVIIGLYSSLIKLATPFNSKAKLFVSGRKGLLEALRNKIDPMDRKVAWFHCASLGEFEQGRPVLERFRKEYPDHFILLTFYSPSGYELKKEYEKADYVSYLPMDTIKNARKFIKITNPSIAFFVKYEFWPNYLSELHKNKIPLISFSTIFRKDQVFFKWYGKAYQRLLTYFDQFFVQNQTSGDLLQQINIQQFQIAGDTRFDRVQQIANQPKHLPEIESFINNHPCMVIGSSWPEDMEVIIPLIVKEFRNLKFIIAPHEIDEKKIQDLIKKVSKPCLRYSKITEKVEDSNILIIDNIGLLSSIYQFANVAYIGGAFGNGLHNTLEAIIYRIPVFFGDRNFSKFQEAMDLVELDAAWPVSDSTQLMQQLRKYFDDLSLQKDIKIKLDSYIESNLGASDKILSFTKKTAVMKGRVIKSTGSWYKVLTEDHQVINSKLRGKFKLENKKITNPVAVGDIVLLHLDENEDHVAVIDQILPRDNYIIRRSVKKSAQHHIIAANIDLAVLIVTFARPRTSIGFVDRYLVTAEAFRIPVLIVFNKADAMNEEELEIQAELKRIYESIGYDTLLMSALELKDVENFKGKIQGKTVLIAGHSGVGKSTILNNISPEIQQKTAEISDFVNKGVHTTTFAEMFPIGDDTFLIDTPGIKELGLSEIDNEELDHYFPEMREYLGKCRFNNCTHVHEPGCKIQELVNSGEIALSRFESYLSMLFNEDNRN